ncbi:MAG: intracellular septation protein [Alphaproteobacteria bacterium]|nr:intracellular septation protein [Alphaproteobacteria bacterium]
MKNLLHAGKFLLADMASTLFFLALYLWTEDVPLAVALGITLGFAQIGRQLLRKAPIDTMQWMSLFLVVASGSATLLTNDPRFVMIKPTIIYIIVGVVMLKPGWMNRYLPAVAMEVVPDLGVVFGFIWSALMFGSGALNVYVALNYSVVVWASFMSIWGITSKLGLFLMQYGIMRAVGVRRRRRRTQPAMA